MSMRTQLKSIVIFSVFSVIFIFCVVGIRRWPQTRKMYVTTVPSPYVSGEFADMSKSDKLLRISNEDIANYKYIRDGIYPIDYTPKYIPLVLISAGAGASLTAAMFCIFLAGTRGAFKMKGGTAHEQC